MFEIPKSDPSKKPSRAREIAKATFLAASLSVPNTISRDSCNSENINTDSLAHTSVEMVDASNVNTKDTKRLIAKKNTKKSEPSLESESFLQKESKQGLWNAIKIFQEKGGDKEMAMFQQILSEFGIKDATILFSEAALVALGAIRGGDALKTTYVVETASGKKIQVAFQRFCEEKDPGLMSVDSLDAVSSNTFHLSVQQNPYDQSVNVTISTRSNDSISDLSYGSFAGIDVHSMNRLEQQGVYDTMGERHITGSHDVDNVSISADDEGVPVQSVVNAHAQYEIQPSGDTNIHVDIEYHAGETTLVFPSFTLQQDGSVYNGPNLYDNQPVYDVVAEDPENGNSSVVAHIACTAGGCVYIGDGELNIAPVDKDGDFVENFPDGQIIYQAIGGILRNSSKIGENQK